MRSFLRALAPALFIAALSGCHPKWYNGKCSTNDNCAKQPGFGKVCFYGECRECGLDRDCKAGFWCREVRCVPRPECEVPFDCGKGRTCELGKCIWAAPAPSASTTTCSSSSAPAGGGTDLEEARNPGLSGPR